MESPPVSHSGNWLSEESWGGPFLSKMSCSIINLLLGNYLQKGGRYQQRNCRREATIGILCTRAGGRGGDAMFPRWSGDMQILASAFVSSRGALQSSRTLLSVGSSSRSSGKAFMHFLLGLVAVFGCCFAWGKVLREAKLLESVLRLWLANISV